ncbi:putative glycosidase [Vanrija pseudolonga]|uniref:Glycosidase n=1 Tax=Vanrija pseudolonga TaxID=143232 RepID=A0AAF0Y9X5_9TREE|nr:putative glycosidase [Vanrija pseudolonga]
MVRPEPWLNTAVTYVDGPTAFKTGLAFWTNEGQPGIQTEHWTTIQPGQPRNSVRISSKAVFGGGLFIFDLALMPWGCGVWPAIWTVGNLGTWPQSGEIDIVEGTQNMTANQMSVHTSSGCTINTSNRVFTGNALETNCDSTKSGVGCSIVSDSDTSFGHNFNAAGGGVYAMHITTGFPTPSAWGLPAGTFDASNCNPFQFFQPQVLVLNINICGDWAGNTYSQFSYCPGTCASYIADPANIQNTVMIINSIKVYQQGGNPAVVGQAFDNRNLTGAGGPVVGRGPLRSLASCTHTALPKTAVILVSFIILIS